MKKYIKSNSDSNYLDSLAKKVAEEFKSDMDEHGFETFDEMAQCYWWSQQDIKDEVDYILRDLTDGKAFIDEIDSTEVIYSDGTIPYRSFSRMWRKYLKTV